MAIIDLFPSEITPDEKAAGFQVVEIPNDFETYVGSPRSFQAVVYPLPPSHRIIKFRYPDGRVQYHLHKFGRFLFFGNRPDPKWTPDLVCTITHDLPWVIQYLSSRMLSENTQMFELVHAPEYHS